MIVELTTFKVVAIAILVVATNCVSFQSGVIHGIENKLNSLYGAFASLTKALRDLIKAVEDESGNDNQDESL